MIYKDRKPRWYHNPFIQWGEILFFMVLIILAAYLWSGR